MCGVGDQLLLACGDGCHDFGVFLPALLALYPDIDQKLRIAGHQFIQLRCFLAGLHEGTKYLRGGDESVTGGGKVAEDDVTGLLAADIMTVGPHILKDIAVTDAGDFYLYTGLLQCLMEADIGHDGAYYGIVFQGSGCLHSQGADDEDVVAVEDIALFIYAEAAVSIAVVGNTDIGTVFLDSRLQTLQMGGAAAVVDIYSVRSFAYYFQRAAQLLQQTRHYSTGCAVGTVKDYTEAVKTAGSGAAEVADIALYQLRAEVNKAHFFAVAAGEVILLLDGGYQLFNFILYGIRQLVAVTAEEFMC